MNPFRIMFPSLGFVSVPSPCCVSLGFHRMKFDMSKIAHWGIYMIRIDLSLPTPIVQDYQERLQDTVKRLTNEQKA